MGRLVITNQVRSSAIGDARAFTCVTTQPVTNGSVIERLVGASWDRVYNNDYVGDPTYVIIINTGDNECIVRGTDDADYVRMTLPAGAAMMFRASLNLEAILPGLAKVDVYSAIGTTVQVGIFS